jgi:hypothetical protein
MQVDIRIPIVQECPHGGGRLHSIIHLSNSGPAGALDAELIRDGSVRERFTIDQDELRRALRLLDEVTP